MEMSDTLYSQRGLNATTELPLGKSSAPLSWQFPASTQNLQSSVAPIATKSVPLPSTQVSPYSQLPLNAKTPADVLGASYSQLPLNSKLPTDVLGSSFNQLPFNAKTPTDVLGTSYSQLPLNSKSPTDVLGSSFNQLPLNAQTPSDVLGTSYAQLPFGTAIPTQPAPFAQLPFSTPLSTALPSSYAQLPFSSPASTAIRSTPYAQLPFSSPVPLADETISRVTSVRNMQEVYDASLQATIQSNLGYYVIIEFLIGNQLVDKEGILYAGGSDYVTIYEVKEDRYVVCDFFSIKFITFYNTKTIPPSRLNGDVLQSAYDSTMPDAYNGTVTPSCNGTAPLAYNGNRAVLGKNGVYKNATFYGKSHCGCNRGY